MKTFEEIYSNVPVARRNMLRQFRMTHPLQKRIIQGVEWEYLTSGQGEQALLILGGGGSRADSGFNTISRLESSLRIFSIAYPPLQRIGALLDGLAELLAAEEIQRVHVYGHSLGSGIAHILVRRHPGLVDKLVLGSFGLYTRSNSRRVQTFIRLLQVMPYSFTRSSYQRRMQAALDITDPQELAFMQAYIEELFTVQLDKKAFVGQMSFIIDMIQHAAEYRIFEAVERPGKVLILQANDDRGFSPTEQQALVDTYPGARVVRFETGGHLIQYTRRDLYQQALDKFLIQA